MKLVTKLLLSQWLSLKINDLWPIGSIEIFVDESVVGEIDENVTSRCFDESKISENDFDWTFQVSKVDPLVAALHCLRPGDNVLKLFLSVIYKFL